MKPKQNYARIPTKDRCQTPPYAIEPIWPFIKNKYVWEPCVGEGTLYNTIKLLGGKIIGSDIIYGKSAFHWQPPHWEVAVTNLPFSQKFEFLDFFMGLDKPFYFIIPFEPLCTAKRAKLEKKHKKELSFFLTDGRINFKMPDIGWGQREQDKKTGRWIKRGSAQLATTWVYWNGSDRQVRDWEINKDWAKDSHDDWLRTYVNGVQGYYSL